MSKLKIIYTETDEGQALSTCSLMPIIRAFAGLAGIVIEGWDVSLAGRIIANFPDHLGVEQRQSDALADLRTLVNTPDANIIKLPNILASIFQIKAAIAELQSKGFDVPDYPEAPQNGVEQAIRERYAKVLGDAVNGALCAKFIAHSTGEWSRESKSHVAHMDDADFYSSEQSAVIEATGNLRIEHLDSAGTVSALRRFVPVVEGEIVDSATMNCAALREFFAREADEARDEGVLLSLHLNATIMNVSDRIIFGHAVTTYYRDVFEKYELLFHKLGVQADSGINDVYAKISGLADAQKAQVELDIETVYKSRPAIAMVDSDRGITNLHEPSNVIVDASMPAMIRSSGQMWGPDGQLADTKALIPDRRCAGVYEEVIMNCKQYGAFDVSAMGNVSNVGLMAQKAEEYGSHDKTFEISADGEVRVVDEGGNVLMRHVVGKGDIWRLSQSRAAPIWDWVKLAVNRARHTGAKAIFWLDENRAHDRHLIKMVKCYLADHDTTNLGMCIMSPVAAMRETLERARNGADTIAVTDHIMRDCLVDLLPILAPGTSAKVSSIVPLPGGGAVYEGGSGGSGPKKVQQFLTEGHLAWDPLAEFLALAFSIGDLASKSDNGKARVLADALNLATANYLANNKSPSRKVNELDTRGSHFYLTLYWAQALAAQSADAELNAQFTPIARALSDHEGRIVAELNAAQGHAVDIGGYYRPDRESTTAAMRPSTTFNNILDAISTMQLDSNSRS